MRISRCVNLR